MTSWLVISAVSSIYFQTFLIQFQIDLNVNTGILLGYGPDIIFPLSNTLLSSLYKDCIYVKNTRFLHATEDLGT